MRAFNLLLFVLLIHAVLADNYCGTSFGDADKCETACPKGLDGECPSGETCYADVDCPDADPPSSSTGNYCGTSFGDADKCETACPKGLDGECPSGETCYAEVSCPDAPPPSDDDGFADDIVSTAEDEYDTYGDRHECNDSGMKERVGDYWAAIGLSQYDGCDRSVPWSAAFVSFMVREAGGGSRFQYSAAHRVYIEDAFAGGQGLYNSVEDIDTATVQTGDIVCTGRARISSWDYDDFRNWYDNGGSSYDAIPSHCDIVVDVSGSTITTVGGNLNQRVLRRTDSKSEYAILLPVTR